jgi:hypothetical protein
MLRKYTIVPAILLALGVGDASAAKIKCQVEANEGVFLRKKDTFDPPDSENKLCVFIQNYRFDAISRRERLEDGRNFVEVEVKKNDPEIFCKWQAVSNSKGDSLHGYVTEWGRDKDGNLLQFSKCQ